MPFGLWPPQSVYFLGVLPLLPHPQFAQGPQLLGDGAVQGSMASGIRVNVLELLYKLGRVSTFWVSFLICETGVEAARPPQGGHKDEKRCE